MRVAVAVDLVAYVRAIKKKVPEGGLAMQWALRISQWGRWVRGQFPLELPPEAAKLLIEGDEKNGQ